MCLTPKKLKRVFFYIRLKVKLQCIFQMYVFFSAFQWQVWILIGITIPVTALVILTSRKVVSRLMGKQFNETFIHHLLNVHGAVLKQGEKY